MGAALEGRRDAVVLATKFHNGMGDDPNMRGNSRRWIVRACEDSLRRLRTDRIDLYQVHRPDPRTDLDETLGALSDLVHQGKVLAWGTSTFPAEELVEVQWTAERRGHVRPVAEQPPYSIFARGIERDVLPTCAAPRPGRARVEPAVGRLADGQVPPRHRRRRPTRGPPPTPTTSTPATPASSTSSRSWPSWPADAGLTLTHLALAWALEHPAVTSVLIGPRTEEQLAGLLGADAVRLDADLLDRIDELVAPGTTISAADEGWVPPALAADVPPPPPLTPPRAVARKRDHRVDFPRNCSRCGETVEPVGPTFRAIAAVDAVGLSGARSCGGAPARPQRTAAAKLCGRDVAAVAEDVPARGLEVDARAARRRRRRARRRARPGRRPRGRCGAPGRRSRRRTASAPSAPRCCGTGRGSPCSARISSSSTSRPVVAGT